MVNGGKWYTVCVCVVQFCAEKRRGFRLWVCVLLQNIKFSNIQKEKHID